MRSGLLVCVEVRVASAFWILIILEKFDWGSSERSIWVKIAAKFRSDVSVLIGFDLVHLDLSYSFETSSVQSLLGLQLYSGTLEGGVFRSSFLVLVLLLGVTVCDIPLENHSWQ